MKKFFLLPLLASTLLFTSCIEGESDDNGEDIIDVDVEENGILGTWVYNPTDEATVRSYVWIIEPTQSRIAKICNFGASNVTASFIVKSEIEFNTLEVLENASDTASGTPCNISVEEGSTYSLNLVSDNVLQISRLGVTKQYTRNIDPTRNTQ